MEYGIMVQTRADISGTLLTDMLSPADTRKARISLSSDVALKNNSTYPKVVQRDLEGIFRIWEGKSRHRQKYTCMHSVNTMKTQLRLRVTPHPKAVGSDHEPRRGVKKRRVG